MPETNNHGNNSLIKNVSVVSLISGLRIAASLIVYILIASVVGLSAKADAFFIAFTIPGLINSVLYSSRYALISSFSKVNRSADSLAFHQLPSTILTVSLIPGFFVSLVCFLGAPVIVFLLAPGTSSETQQIATQLLRILGWIPIFASLNTILGALLNSANRFVIPAISETIVFVTAIVAGISFREGGIISISWGFFLGAVVQFLVLLLATYVQIDYRFVPTLDLGNKWVIDTLQLAWVSIQGMLLRFGTPLSDRLFASFLPAGSIALIQYGSRFVAPTSFIFYDSIVAVSMPTLAASLGQGKDSETKSLLRSNWRLLQLISLPLTAVIIGLNFPLVSIVFQRGAFGRAAVEQVVPLSLAYNLSLLFYGYTRLQDAFLYTIENKSKIIQLIGLITLTDVVIKAGLVLVVGPMAAAIAFTLSNAITAIVGSRVVARLQGLELKNLISLDLGLTFVAMIIGISCYLVSNQITGLLAVSEPIANLAGIFGGGLLSLIILSLYFILYRREEVRNLSYTLR